MALTEHQTLNTVAPLVDVRLRYFSGPYYSLLIKSGLASIFNTWTGPDTGVPAGWTEITDRVSWRSSLRHSLQGNTITFEASLSGSNYDDVLLGPGLALVCWRQIFRPTGTGTAPAGWQAWQLEFIGQITDRDNENDYRNGKEWHRTITGHNSWLERVNAPRLTAGKIAIVQDSSTSISGSDPLAQPEQERDKGEFVGGSANVGLDNLKDGNNNTVYISGMIPSYSDPGRPGTSWDGSVQLTELFLKPVGGWPANKCWWIEFFNQRSQDQDVALDLTFANWNGGNPAFYRANYNRLAQGQWGIICGNQQYFDLYTGARNSGAAWVQDASTVRSDMTLDPLDGMVFVNGTWNRIAWAPGGAYRHYEYRPDPKKDAQVLWDGPTLDSTAITAGYSWIYDLSGNQAPSDWTPNANPHPGCNNNGIGPVCLKVLLPDNVCETQDALTSASTVIRLNNYRSWVTPPAGQWAYGIVAGYKFKWNSRDASGLKGVQWIDVPGASIPYPTRCYPYANDQLQTGYPLVSTSINRRKHPVVKHYKVYWSQIDARDYLQDGWQNDYHGHYHETQGNTQKLILSDLTADSAGAYLWVRSFMYLIYQMTDGGRVKLNEIEADLAQAALDFSGLPDLDGRRSAELACYLFTTWAGLNSGDFLDASSRNTHFMGQHALAITPIAKVLDDLARATGCLCWFAPDGKVHWLDDPWWILAGAPAIAYSFDADSIRGSVAVQGKPANVDYVILNALSLDGSRPHAMRYVYPKPAGGGDPPVSAMTTEVNDLVIAHDSDADDVAQREYQRSVLGGYTAQVAVKGTGEWCFPGQRVTLTYDLDGDGWPETTHWTIEQVTVTREGDATSRSQTTELTLRSYVGQAIYMGY